MWTSKSVQRGPDGFEVTYTFNVPLTDHTNDDAVSVESFSSIKSDVLVTRRVQPRKKLNLTKRFFGDRDDGNDSNSDTLPVSPVETIGTFENAVRSIHAFNKKIALKFGFNLNEKCSSLLDRNKSVPEGTPVSPLDQLWDICAKSSLGLQ